MSFKNWSKAKHVSERRTFFSEQRRSFQLPDYGSAQKPNSVAVNQSEALAIGVQSPVGVYLSKNGAITYVDLWDAVNLGRHGFQAKLNLCPLPHGEFLVQERATNQMFIIRKDTENEEQRAFRLCPSSGTVFGKYGYRRGECMPGGVNDPKPEKSMREFKICSDFSETDGIVFFYSSNDTFIHRIKFDTEEDPERPKMERFDLGFRPWNVQQISQNTLLIEDLDGYYRLIDIDDENSKITVRDIDNARPISISPFSPAERMIENLTGVTSDGDLDSRCFISGSSASGILIGAPGDPTEFQEHEFPRPAEVSGGTMSSPVWLSGSVCAQLVAPRRVPASIFSEENPRPLGAGAFIELVDFNRKKLSYVPIPEVQEHTRGDFRWYNRAEDYCMGGANKSGLVVTADGTGRIREFDSYREAIDTGMKEWQKMVGKGKGGDGTLRVEYERNSGEDMKLPKHGKEDPNNDPHVGGNTWAGGTGGRDTAGLGGKGGPYRLDKVN